MPADNVILLPTDAPRTDAATVRLTVERLEGMRLIGWALDPATAGRERISLRCGGLLLDAPVRRLPRADVRQATGADTDMLGFELELPLSIWQAMAESGAGLQLLVNDVATEQPRLRPTHKGLQDWMGRIEHHADPTRREALLRPLRAHLEQALAWPAQTAEPEADQLLPAPCHLEGWRGLSLSGWVADTPTRRESIRLRCADRLLDCPVQRISRKDVAQVMLLEHEDIGFELEVPGTVWELARGASEVTLQAVVGQRACGAPLTLRRDELADRLDSALALTDSSRRSHQALLAMEHLVLAGELHQLDHGLSTALAALAESAGVAHWLKPTGRLSTATPALAAPRQPQRLGPRGRLGKWLMQPANARLALRLLEALKRRPWLASHAESLEVRLTQSLGLFDKALYEEQMPLERRQGLPALRHYVRFGDALSLVPMCLFDPRHYTGQLDGRRHPGVNRLLHYGLWGRFEGLSTCAWFDGEYYRQANRDVQDSRLDPLVHFVNWGWKEHRRPHPAFEPTLGARQGLMQRLARSGATGHTDPLVNFLLEGLPAVVPQPDRSRLPWVPPTRLDGRDYLEPGPWLKLPPRPKTAVVDIIVPVYAGVQESLRCLWSVLAAPVRTHFELVVIDDCSPDPALSAFLRELAAMGQIRLLVNPRNLGFVATVNSGLALHWDRDVVILNADTQVHGDWLDRLVAHAQAEPLAASITPLSNNATVCSYPRTLHSNWERLEVDSAALDRLAASANAGLHVSVPTGVGFCMWMRRSCLDAVGLLDVERFGRGYGEENDWCMRANRAGWLQLIATDVFVLHQGSVSFQSESHERTRAAISALLERYPDYQQRIDEWIAADPLRPARARLDAARLRQPAAEPAAGGETRGDLPGPSPGARLGTVLMVSHARGGGTARHEQEQASRLLAEQGLVTVFMRPSRLKGRVALSGTGVTEVPNLDALPLQAEGLLLDLLRTLSVREVQLHHLADHHGSLRQLLPGWARALGVPLKVTLHDYHFVCPRINLVDASGRYCGEPLPAACDQCLSQDAAGRSAGPIVAWRQAHHELLRHAAERVVPDEDVSTRLGRYFPELSFSVRPHEPKLVLPAPGPRPALRHLLVIGSLSVIKGYEVLLGLARSRAAKAAGLRFTLIGHSVNDQALKGAGVEVRGRYEDHELAQLIEDADPDLILLPSVWPETYSYVLSAAMASGRRVATFDLGAPARRLREAGADALYLPIDEVAHPELLAARLVAG